MTWLPERPVGSCGVFAQLVPFNTTRGRARVKHIELRLVQDAIVQLVPFNIIRGKARVKPTGLRMVQDAVSWGFSLSVSDALE